MEGRLWCDTRVQGFKSGGQKGSRVVGKLVQVWKAPIGRGLRALCLRGSFHGVWTTPPVKVAEVQSGKAGASGQCALRKL